MQGVEGPGEVVEVVLSWGDSVVATKYLREGDVFALGEDDGCDAVVPREVLGATRVECVTCDALGAAVFPPRGAHTWVDAFPTAGERIVIEESQSIEIAICAFTLRARRVPDEHVATSWVDGVSAKDFSGVAVSILAHASIFAALALFLPPLGATDEDAISRDQMLTMRHLLDASAQREEDAQRDEDHSSANEPEDHGASGGGRALGAAGTMGAEHAPKTPAHWSAAGDTPRDLATLSRDEKRALVRDFSGMIGLLASVTSDPNAPTVPWGERLSGADKDSHLGSIYGAEAGDTWGIGGLTLSGTDEGGGGPTIGIGVNDVGGLSASLDRRLGSGDPGGWGHGCGGKPCLAGHHPHAPMSMRMPVDITTNGRIPKDVIQRIVRMNMGRFRACYESGLRTNPSLGGRVVVKFVIDREGRVSIAQDGGSDLPNDAVNRCIVQSFYSLSFPSPEGGTVAVVYPITLNPAD